MSDLLDMAMEAMRRLPAPAREGMARAILTLARDVSPDAIPADHLPFVLEGLAQVERGEFATDAEIAEAFGEFDK